MYWLGSPYFLSFSPVKRSDSETEGMADVVRNSGPGRFVGVRQTAFSLSVFLVCSHVRARRVRAVRRRMQAC